MSGVFGYFGRIEDASTVAKRMGAAMRHGPLPTIAASAAGPDGVLGHIGVGPLRHTAQSTQGVETVSLSMCGEFYYQERRVERMCTGADTHDDGALALDTYLREGAPGLIKLDGAFAIAIWDGRTREVVLINDRFGLYQHFYAHVGNAFVFAPEIKGILAAPKMPRRLDQTAVAQYIRFQQLLGERTWLEDVHVLPPATLLRYRPDDNSLSLERYWDWDRITLAPSINLGEAIQETTRLFQRTIDEMIKPPLRVGVYLSGGLDGRTILGFIGQKRP